MWRQRNRSCQWSSIPSSSICLVLFRHWSRLNIPRIFLKSVLVVPTGAKPWHFSNIFQHGPTDFGGVMFFGFPSFPHGRMKSVCLCSLNMSTEENCSRDRFWLVYIVSTVAYRKLDWSELCVSRYLRREGRLPNDHVRFYSGETWHLREYCFVVVSFVLFI